MKPDEAPSGNEALWSMLWGDASPGERARFLRIAFRIGVTFHIMWACGFLASFGLTGFAWANDLSRAVKDVEHQHVELIAPINKRLDDITLQLEEASKVQKRILIGQLASQLRDLNRMRCLTADERTRTRVEEDMETAQDSYRALTGERYPFTLCKDL
jgi:hypothetical protein